MAFKYSFENLPLTRRFTWWTFDLGWLGGLRVEGQARSRIGVIVDV
jgi:hypothetical protein